MTSPDLHLGSSGDVILQLTTTLSRLSFLSAPSSEFDAEVQAAVKAFQQERGLTATGIVDAITSRNLEEARWKLGDRTLKFNISSMMRGDDVAALQSRLTEMGFNCGRVDGIFGEMTEIAVKDFQKSAGILIIFLQ